MSTTLSATHHRPRKIKASFSKRFKITRRLWFFHTVRWAERRLSVANLYRAMRVYAFVRAALRGMPNAVQLPACLCDGNSPHTIRESRMRGYSYSAPEFLPDRLAEEKWKPHIHIEGLDRLLQTQREGRPVILTFFHFDAYRLASICLRAAGFHVAVLIYGEAAERPRADLLNDTFSPFPARPTTFYRDQLRELDDYLAAGNALLIAVDTARGNTMQVPVCDGWTFEMATGAIRLAIRRKAELMSCAVIDEGRWNFRIQIGQPVPPEYLAAKGDYVQAGKHLLDEMLPLFRQHPELCSRRFVKYFRQAEDVRPQG